MNRRFWLLLVALAGIGFLVWSFLSARGGGWATREVVTIKETAPPPATTGPYSFRQAAHKAMSSVVNVYTLKQVVTRRGPGFGHPFGQLFGVPAPQPATSLGSGVVVSADGYILTNNHVIEGADEIAVAFPTGEAAEARMVGGDPETDLAVLKIEAKGLVPVTFADPASVEVGDPVLAIGNPFGVGQTVTQGIVSATGRNRLGINAFENFIQTDAAINPGNSGGALVDASGALIGINTAIFSQSGGSQGIGFAIPVSIARQVLEQILKTGRVERGWLGIEAREIRRENGRPEVVIAGVLRGGPADVGGIRPGDVVVSINQRPVTDTVDLINRIAAVAPGSSLGISVRRDGFELPLRLRAGKRPALRGVE
ncbi:S1C family serine protease [Ampullimonas aquatilis]|uniref:S1C family serine protease n=1 Tax=Ampullimonas aquatilis TaxID=1341549 RepID=UPI00377B92BB